MSTYVVTYDLHTPGQKYECLSKKLEAYGTYYHIQGSVWIIKTNKSAAAVRDELVGCLDGNDKLIVARLSGEAAWYGYPTNGSEWLKDDLERAAA